MKPDCKLCAEKDETLSSLLSFLAKDMLEKLLFGFLNPESLKIGEGKEFDVDSMIEEHEKEMDVKEEQNHSAQRTKLRQATKKAWEKLLEKLKKNETHPPELSMAQIAKQFYTLIAEELIKEGLPEEVINKEFSKEGLLDIEIEQDKDQDHVSYVLTAKSEKIIAKKVLEEAFANLRKYSIGLHEIEQTYFGTEPSHILREYDDYQHTYDMLDIQETLINTVLRDPKNMEILKDDLKARIPFHKSKSANIIIIDKSGSMNGQKIKGAIMSALGLRELLETEYKEDSLHIIACDHTAYELKSGEIIRLIAHGWTDIGQALDMAREILSKEEGNRNIFLITDGEPTASCYPDQTPEENAFRATNQCGKADIRMNIIMMDSRPSLRHFCEEIAVLNGNATVAFIDNPLDLSEFVIKSYIDYRRQLSKML